MLTLHKAIAFFKFLHLSSQGTSIHYRPVCMCVSSTQDCNTSQIILLNLTCGCVLRIQTTDSFA